MNIMYPTSDTLKVIKENEPSIQYYKNNDSFISYVDFEPVQINASMHMDTSRQYELFR